ncbi:MULTISPECIES: plasmid partitioning protein RepB [Rhizobium/Agrobacterium group]|uniref:Replication protein B n=2 Tax=Rhizobium/Agrobacterium group TaxID=227290 RepID=B9K3Z7_ALLAM|nr:MULTISPECIES: plasmid partitioning protein RepB [Rhizobium/Agrobacterium group]ACM39652.1 replication protein B [Allorhizobium ampelinum S4]ASK49688.1 hypothetical protein [Agrobacterium vitis]OVE86809.1 plasmid partitioning protein RepB [Allorhizobium ampelinum]BCH68226.1 hypothetical protein RvVAT039_pl10590 [Agrobacterium vitis]
MMVNPEERSQQMNSLFGHIDTDGLAKQSSPLRFGQEKLRVGSAVVKSMDRAFVSIEDENRRLHNQLLSSGSAVELDPDRVAPSFINNRLDIEGDESFHTFVEGIKEAGQKLPILVRPLAGKLAHYRAAYGHRRLPACQILKRSAKAIVRELSDEEPVVSQGIENSERLNLSFNEQALFALNLKERKYSRELISDALGRNQGQRRAYISILINTAALIPEELIRPMGSPPSMGRPKWEKLGAFINNRNLSARRKKILADVTASPAWEKIGSARRFALIMTAFNRSTKCGPDLVEVSLDDGIIIVAKQTDKPTHISIPDNRFPGLSDWLLQRLPDLFEEFQWDNERF